MKLELVKRDGLKCAITDEKVNSIEELDIDYIIPKSQGGTDDLNNLILVRSHINRKFSNKISLDLIQNSLPGMRENGQVAIRNGYWIAEYEPRNLRLDDLGEEVHRNIESHFILYDYKGTIRSNNQEVLNFLHSKYKSNIEINQDVLYIDDEAMQLIELPIQKKIYYKKSLLNENHQKSNLGVAFNQTIEIKNKIDLKPVLGVKTIANTLADIIIKQPDKEGMMIGVFGKWGRGKTYLVNKTWESLKKNKPQFIRVNFSAWKYQDTKASWAYLYENLLNSYLLNDDGSTPCVCKYYKRIFALNANKTTLAPLFIFLALLLTSFIWTFFVDKISLLKILLNFTGVIVLIQAFFFYQKHKNSVIGLYNKYFSKKNFSDYLGLQSEIENEIAILLKTWIPEPDKNKQVILFVDDIDRCKIEQILDIMDGLRIILDNKEIHERLLIITAIDEKILYSALKKKYEFIEDTSLKDLYHEYLEKIFIIGLKLNHLNSEESQEFLKNLFPESNTILDNSTEEQVSAVQETSELSIEENLGLIENQEDTLGLIESQEDDLEINKYEQDYLLNAITRLENSTPRKIRIFYYKYLITKKLFEVRLKEKNLENNWTTESDEKVIADILIEVSNKQHCNDFSSRKNDNLIKELKYTAEMVSIL